MRKKLLHLLLNQYFITVIISFAIIYFLPTYFTKYKIEFIESHILHRENSQVYYEDLNNDAISEKIISYDNNAGNAAFEIQNSTNGIIDQWNFNKQRNKGRNKLFFLDIDTNGYKEIINFTQNKDSIFLNITEPFVKKGIQIRTIFIDVVVEHNNEYITGINYIDLGKKDSNGFCELYFELNTGFGGSPRNIYKYNYSTDKVTKSPHLTNTLTISFLEDINEDGLDEILLQGYANGNEIDSIYTTRSDYSSWFTVLDTNLNFLFEPIEINIPFSKILTLPIKLKNEFKLLCLIDSRGNSVNKDKIEVYTAKGMLEKKKPLPPGFYNTFQKYKNNKLILHNSDNGNIVIFNKNLQEISNFNIGEKGDLKSIDIEQDGGQEWLNISRNYESISIYREDFTHPISFELPSGNFKLIHFGVIHNENIKNGIYFQKENSYFVYRYFKNPLYFFKYLVYLGILIVIYALIWLIAKGQKIRMEKQLAIEKEIAQLQIKTIKNQVDPHFVFNAINTISEMMLTDNKLEVDNFICKFSALMRKTLQGSDKISHTLQEELDYVENFIQLQQIRFNNSFQYHIAIDKNIHLETIVPKHILYTYVENAIKHGLSNNANGNLKINITQQKQHLVLTIEDNGGGFNTTKKTNLNSTGNGMLIMEKIYAMYFKLYKEKISHSITEVVDPTNNTKGIKIEVIVKNKFKH